MIKECQKMNKWKVAFFGLLGAIILLLCLVIYWATSPVDTPITTPKDIEVKPTESVLIVETTTDDFEKMAMKYLSKELKNASLPVDIEVTDSIELFSEIIAFGISVPVSMKFEPVVNEQGNIHLQQKEVNLGSLNLPPSMILKLMDEAIEFPDWMMIRPNEEEIYVDLSKLTLSSGVKVKAKKIDLQNNYIQLEVVVPNN